MADKEIAITGCQHGAGFLCKCCWPMADQEINEAVAKKLGYTKDFDFGWIIPKRHKDGFCVGQTSLPDFCHSIEAAWEIVSYLEKQGFLWGLYKHAKGGYSFGCGNPKAVNENAETASMAICKAFLKLLG